MLMALDTMATCEILFSQNPPPKIPMYATAYTVASPGPLGNVISEDGRCLRVSYFYIFVKREPGRYGFSLLVVKTIFYEYKKLNEKII